MASDPLAGGGQRAGSLRPYASGLAFGFFNAINWMICLGIPMVMMAGQLGADSFQVGLAYAAVFLTLPIQVLATAFLPRYGYKRQMMFAWRTRSVALLIPLGLALAAPETPPAWMSWALVGSIYLFCLLRALGSCCYIPWLHALLPEEIRGRFFAMDQFVSGFAGVMTLLGCAILFAWLPPYHAFAVEYVAAILGAVFSNYFLSRLPDVPKPVSANLQRLASLVPELMRRPGDFRHYLFLTLAQSAAAAALVPFGAYYLRTEAAQPIQTIMVFTACQYAGAIAGSWSIRNSIDRRGPRLAFVRSMAVTILAMLFWFFLVQGHASLLVWLPACYFASGLAASNFATAHLKYLPAVCPLEQRALAISVQSALVGVLSGLAPLLIGLYVKTGGSRPGLNHDNFGIYLLVAMGVLAALLPLFWRLPWKGDTPGWPLAGSVVLRQFRYFGQLINLTEAPIQPGKTLEKPMPSHPPPEERSPADRVDEPDQ